MNDTINPISKLISPAASKAAGGYGRERWPGPQARAPDCPGPLVSFRTICRETDRNPPSECWGFELLNGIEYNG